MQSDLPPQAATAPSAPTERHSFLEQRRQVRELLARIRAIVRHMAAAEQPTERFVALLEGRLGALARVQEILLRAPDVLPDLMELVDAELLAQSIPHDRITVGGPPVLLSARVAGSLALAIHELVINAIQFGALGGGAGQVAVSWTLDAARGEVQLNWHETGSEVREPGKKGFGWELLQNTLAYELGARTELRLDRDGLLCVINFRPQGGRP